jgi:hypothetical protein
MKLMEPKEQMDEMGLKNRANFIGKKCHKFLGNNAQPKNTVSIVPIIGRTQRLS